VLAWLSTLVVGHAVTTDVIVPAMMLSVVVGIAAIATSRLYQARVCSVRSTEFARLGPVALAAASPAIFLPMMIHREEHVAATVALAATLFLLLVFERSSFDAWLRSQRANGRYCRSLIIVGTAAEARDLSTLLRDHAEFGFRVVGFVGPDPKGDVLPAGIPWRGEVSAIHQALEQAPANGVLIASDALPAQQMTPLVWP
jgi:FlaA1/EpsC-like NDP-sugar epimerase